MITLAALILTLSSLEIRADDKIIKQDGSAMAGTVTGVRDGQVQIKLGAGVIGFPLAQVKSVEMSAPPALDAVRNDTPDKIVAVVGPLVETFKGLPAPWVIDAMELLGNAYASQDNLDKSNAVFEEMKKFYGDQGTTASSIPAKVGAARNALKQGNADAAIAALQPILDQAKATIAHSPAENAALGGAFLLYGQALEAKGEAPEALEAYLTTTTLFNRNEAAAKTAQDKADALRAAHPDLKTL